MIKLNTKKTTTFLILTTLCISLHARHIIGGVITYECRGEGQYDFTLRMYRDCNCTMCAQFDPQAFIAVYKCDVDGDCSSLGQFDFETRISPSLGNVTNVAAPDYPCLIPPNVCVQEGVYTFSLNLPVTNESYHISYQRCCRNVTINNIVQPENAGATYTIEITPEAQALCNSSPVFNSFPPTVICGGAELEFDHSATDADGDQLVYEFCSPLLGGGPLLDQPRYNSCEGANPNPACPPPYDNVRFRAPNFTASRPMSGDPVIAIDPNTGLITGIPDQLGQYVVGVCVSEFRNGVLLSRVFRDFQFNVASCDPTVVADIEEDRVIGDQQFVINSCGVNEITFINQSFREQFIDFFEWRFDINGQREVFKEWSPTVTFPGVGTYEGELILNPGTDCGDTANIFVNVFPDITADFTSDYDTCFAGPVQFTDLSETGSCCLTGWEWQFGDGNASNRRNPIHTYRIPGDIPVTLTVRDTNQCVASTTKIVEYFPVPSLIVIAPSDFVGCEPATIFFDNLSFPIDSTYDIFWDFGDGGTSTDISPTYTFEEPGDFTVSVDITSPIGCETDTIFPNLIEILPSPDAGFSFQPEVPSNLNPTVFFNDESTGGISWLWDFGIGRNSSQRSPSFTFPDTGRYEVRQIVTHPSGCVDTAIQIIDIIPLVTYHLPNAFTPNDDTVNDLFKGVGILEGARNFSMSIWNRWGEKVFETSDPEQGWNGRKFNTGSVAPNGVYVVVVNYIGPRGKEFEHRGFATLIR